MAAEREHDGPCRQFVDRIAEMFGDDGDEAKSAPAGVALSHNADWRGRLRNHVNERLADVR